MAIRLKRVLEDFVTQLFSAQLPPILRDMGNNGLNTGAFLVGPETNQFAATPHSRAASRQIRADTRHSP